MLHLSSQKKKLIHFLLRKDIMNYFYQTLDSIENCFFFFPPVLMNSKNNLNLIYNLLIYIKTFRANLIFLYSQVRDHNFINTTHCAKFKNREKKELKIFFLVKNLVISNLKQKFQNQFADLNTNARKIRFSKFIWSWLLI